MKLIRPFFSNLKPDEIFFIIYDMIYYHNIRLEKYCTINDFKTCLENFLQCEQQIENILVFFKKFHLIFDIIDDTYICIRVNLKNNISINDKNYYYQYIYSTLKST